MSTTLFPAPLTRRGEWLESGNLQLSAGFARSQRLFEPVVTDAERIAIARRVLPDYRRIVERSIESLDLLRSATGSKTCKADLGREIAAKRALLADIDKALAD